MPSPFLDLDASTILARITSIASTAAGSPVTVRIGEEQHQHRNVGVDLPRQRTADATRRLRLAVRTALECDGVVLAPFALAERVEGQIRGSVEVRKLEVRERCADFAHIQRSAPVWKP